MSTIIHSVIDTDHDCNVHFLSDGTAVIHSTNWKSDHTDHTTDAYWTEGHTTTQITYLPSHVAGLEACWFWSSFTTPSHQVDKIGPFHLFKVTQLPDHPIITMVESDSQVFLHKFAIHATLTEARNSAHSHSHSHSHTRRIA